jgi:methylmalonyl-CoA mutase C-terminal domain/subunit
MSDVPVFGGGIIPEEDVPGLVAAGITKIFSPGASLDEIVRWVRENVRPRGVAA